MVENRQPCGRIHADGGQAAMRGRFQLAQVHRHLVDPLRRLIEMKDHAAQHQLV